MFYRRPRTRLSRQELRTITSLEAETRHKYSPLPSPGRSIVVSRVRLEPRPGICFFPWKNRVALALSLIIFIADRYRKKITVLSVALREKQSVLNTNSGMRGIRRVVSLQSTRYNSSLPVIGLISTLHAFYGRNQSHGSHF